MLSRSSRLTLGNPKDCSPPGSSVHEILQARILEWGVVPSSRGTSQLRDGICIFYVSCIVGVFFTTGATWEAQKLHTLLQCILKLQNKLNTVAKVILEKFRNLSPTWKLHVLVKVTQLCPTLCDPMEYTVHGILQARILEWVAISFSPGGLPNPGMDPRSPTVQADKTVVKF